jgi:hypothetical protein
MWSPFDLLISSLAKNLSVSDIIFVDLELNAILNLQKFLWRLADDRCLNVAPQVLLLQKYIRLALHTWSNIDMIKMSTSIYYSQIKQHSIYVISHTKMCLSSRVNYPKKMYLDYILYVMFTSQLCKNNEIYVQKN